jgi:hypothetical protein
VEKLTLIYKQQGKLKPAGQPKVKSTAVVDTLAKLRQKRAGRESYRMKNLIFLMILSVFLVACSSSSQLECEAQRVEVLQGTAKSIPFHEKAAGRGSLYSMIRLAEIYNGSLRYGKAIEWYRKAHEKELALLQEKVIKINQTKAVEALGNYYLFGLGTKKDIDTAIRVMEANRNMTMVCNEYNLLTAYMKNPSMNNIEKAKKRVQMFLSSVVRDKEGLITSQGIFLKSYIQFIKDNGVTIETDSVVLAKTYENVTAQLQLFGKLYRTKDKADRNKLEHQVQVLQKNSRVVVKNLDVIKLANRLRFKKCNIAPAKTLPLPTKCKK